HAGYLLVAVVSGGSGSAAFIFYLVAYGITTIAAFALLAAKGKGGESDVRIDDLSGLSSSRPWLAFALTVSMLSLLGFPGTAGFMGKWYILVGAVANGHTTLAIILVLTSVASAGYYLPVVMAMYMKPATHAEAHSGMVFDRIGRVTLAVAVVAMLWFGVAPGRLFDLSRTSGASLKAAPAMADGPAPASGTTSAR
ncbi:MAG TPA: proton-conducting transporter membrane subunit, partial [Gemmatimonadales bacterium]|nr:proton-conducting transporter membrane subunit [Gemmatimonadales bacterium]